MNIFIIDKVHQNLIEILTNNNFRIDYKPDILANNIINEIPDYEGLIVRSKTRITEEIISKGKNLKFIARLGSGLDNIDVSYAKSKNIICINSPEGNRNAVAEHALGMLLSFFNNICRANTAVKNGLWQREKNRGIELEGKTVGIIGFGNTGSQFAKILSGININILAYDKYKIGFGNEIVKETSLDEIFKQTDILSLHVPLNAETHYMVNDSFIANFHKDIYLINTARGGVVCTEDLISNLKTKKVLGAMLDVLEYESEDLSALQLVENKANFKYLQNSQNVMLTPHIAGWSDTSFCKLSEVLAQKIIERFGK